MISLQLPNFFIDLQIPLLFINNILGLAIGPKHHVLRLGLTLPVLVLLVSQSFYRQWGNEWGIRYALECLMLGVVFIYIDWNILCSPDKEKWYKIQYGTAQSGEAGKDRKDTVPQGFLARTWWGIRLATGTRYIGWSSQVKNVPMECDPDYPRWLFIVRKSLRALFFYLLVDFFNAYTASTPHGSWSDITHIKFITHYKDQPFLSRWYFAWVQIVLSYVNLAHVNAMHSVLSVATGLANPRDCPNICGDLKGLITVRKAWSVVWHQLFRRIFSAPSIFIARDVLQLRRGSFASKYLQLFVAFGISGIIHAGASMFANGSLDDDAAFSFFIGQAIIIMVEDHVIDMGKRMGLEDSKFWRVIGFAWTVFALGASSEKWTSSVVGKGLWVHRRKPDYFSVGPQMIA